MTEPGSNPPELTPAEEDAVRRHLAAARHTEPMPHAVAERLDRVLVGLADERTPAPSAQPAAPVFDLATRRRRRGVQLLVAAAAVVVAGVGFDQLSGTGSEDDSSRPASSADQGNRALDSGPESGPAGGSENPSPESSPTAPEPTGRDQAALSRLPVIRPDHFRADVAQPPIPMAGKPMADTYERARKAFEAACPGVAKGERTLVVTYAGTLAEVVYYTPGDDGQRVELYRCDRDGTSGYIRSVVLPTP